MLRTLGRGGDKRQVDGCLLHLRQLDFGLLSSFLETLPGHLVGSEVDTFRVFELFDEPVDDGLVPVVATQVGVARGGLDLKHAVGDFQHRNVEGAATQVEHQDGLV